MVTDEAVVVDEEDFVDEDGEVAPVVAADKSSLPTDPPYQSKTRKIILQQSSAIYFFHYWYPPLTVQNLLVTQFRQFNLKLAIFAYNCANNRMFR